jgi:5-carboxymethyl-2-hydroxymuconate isomerase
VPHCIIEFSSSLDISPALLVEAVHHGVMKSTLFEPSHIKTRALAYEHFRLAEDYNDFIHVTIRLHHGRTTQQKQQLTKLVLRQLEKLSLKSTTITLETVDIDTESYAKAVIA